MAKAPAIPPDKPNGTRFVVDLDNVDLTDQEVEAVQNQIARTALQVAQSKAGSGATGRKKEPYVKIIHVKTVHVRTIKK
jgi:hypothetical protein